MLPKLDRAHMLDVGCGTGVLTLELAILAPPDRDACLGRDFLRGHLVNSSCEHFNLIGNLPTVLD